MGIVQGQFRASPRDEALVEVGWRRHAMRRQVRERLTHLRGHIDHQNRRKLLKFVEQIGLGVRARPRLRAGPAVPGRPLRDVFGALRPGPRRSRLLWRLRHWWLRHRWLLHRWPPFARWFWAGVSRPARPVWAPKLRPPAPAGPSRFGAPHRDARRRVALRPPTRDGAGVGIGRAAVPRVAPPRSVGVGGRMANGSVGGGAAGLVRGGNGGGFAGTRRSTHGAGRPHEQRRQSVRHRRRCVGAYGTGGVVLRRLGMGSQ